MAWITVKVKSGSDEWVAQMSSTSSNPVFSLPFQSGISAGDSFTVGKKGYTCVNAVNLAQRDETLLVEAKENNDDKQNARRTVAKSRGKDLSVQSVDGHDPED